MPDLNLEIGGYYRNKLGLIIGPLENSGAAGILKCDGHGEFQIHNGEYTDRDEWHLNLVEQVFPISKEDWDLLQAAKAEKEHLKNFMPGTGLMLCSETETKEEGK